MVMEGGQEANSIMITKVIDKQGYNMDSQMDNEVEDYMKGKSKYIKGKGWQ